MSVASVREAVEALNSGDLDLYVRAFSPDCRRWTPGVEQPLSPKEVGDGLRAMISALEDFRLETVELFGQDLLVCAHWRMVGKHVGDSLGLPPTGRSISVDTAEIYRFDAGGSGLIVESRSFGDPNDFLRQLGVFAPAGEGGS